jgi:hypothetical protein
MIRSYQVRIDRSHPTLKEERAWIEGQYERQPALLELPLILVPEYLFEIYEFWKNSPIVIAALNEWITKAKEDDLRLNIERRWIPTAEIYIRDTRIGEKFFNIANAVGEIIPSVNIIPRNQNQAYWLKILHYYWQARGVLLAYKLFGVIPNPIAEQGVLCRYLPKNLIEDLDLLTNMDVAQLRLLVTGERYIRKWAARQKTPYPFNNALELFLEILKQNFLELWQLGPMNTDPNWLSNAQQRDNISALIRLLEKHPWLPGNPLRPPYAEMKQDYLKYLKNASWKDKWVVPLRKRFDKEQLTRKLLSRRFSDYTQSLKGGKELFVSAFNWRGGQPYKTRATNQVQPVKGVVDRLMYIVLLWA